MKIFGQISQVMDKIENQYQYIFLTLTIRNCSGKNLTKEINRLQEGFRALTRNAKIKKAFKGTFRALEVTHHPEYLKEVEYHPHLHIIVAVNPSYFTSRDYISQPELIRIWRECAKLDYDPSVRIQKVVEQKNKNRDEISIKGAVCELSKYTIKASEINFGSFAEIDRRVLTYTEALSGRRLCAFTGIFKKTAAELKLDDITDGDLVLTNNKIRYDVGTMIIRYQWQAGIGYTHKYTKVLEENYASQDPGD